MHYVMMSDYGIQWIMLLRYRKARDVKFNRQRWKGINENVGAQI